MLYSSPESPDYQSTKSPLINTRACSKHAQFYLLLHAHRCDHHGIIIFYLTLYTAQNGMNKWAVWKEAILHECTYVYVCTRKIRSLNIQL